MGFAMGFSMDTKIPWDFLGFLEVSLDPHLRGLCRLSTMNVDVGEKKERIT